MAALFGGSSGSSRREPRSLVEFRAGKMRLSGTTVTADAQKGLIYMKLDDGLVHFYWKDRKNSKVVDDLIIFPGDAEFKQVAQCKTGRVFLLKFRDSSRKYFYWMQEPNEEKDDELVKKVNDIIDHPPDPSQPSADTLSGLGLPPGLMNNPQILEQLISSGAVPPGLLGLEGLNRGGATGSSLAATGSSLGATGSSLASAGGNDTVSASNNIPSSSSTRQHTSSRRQQQPQPESQQQSAAGRAIQLSDLQSILSSINVPESSNNQVSVNLNEALTSDVLRPLSNDSSLHEQVSSFLPPTSEDVPTILNSPQFHQALGIFGSALQSGQLGPLMTQFGLGQGVTEAANTGDIQRFAEALQTEMCADETTSESTESDKPKDEDSKNEKKSNVDKNDKDNSA